MRRRPKTAVMTGVTVGDQDGVVHHNPYTTDPSYVGSAIYIPPQR